jgi:hypothetical protein
MQKITLLDFASGRSKFLDFIITAKEPTAKIFVRICLEGQYHSSLYAQVDTGAAWSVLDPNVAAAFGLLHHPGEPAILSSRLGLLKGTQVRVPVRFLADDGESIDIEGTFFVSPDLPPGRTFLGYSGLLEFIRFAFDPQVNYFYFGPGI